MRWVLTVGRIAGRPADEDFEDLAIFSACRRVLVWRWARGPVPTQSLLSVDSSRVAAKRARRPPADGAGSDVALDFGLPNA